MLFPPNPPIPSFAGLRIWIAGASIAAGARVAVSARSADILQREFGESARVLPCDVTDATGLQAAADTLINEWGGIDLVIAMAGTYSTMRADTLDLDAAKRIVEVNLNGVFNLFAAVGPQLLKQGRGGFAIVASVAGYGGLPNSMAYSATKAACINLAQSMWMDLRNRGVAVTIINPGFVRTPLTATNPFPMPFLIDADEAAREILKGLARGEFEIHFPKAFSRMLKLLNLLPHGLYLRLVKKGTRM
jgi:short-subunit dehydrogenase